MYAGRPLVYEIQDITTVLSQICESKCLTLKARQDWPTVYLDAPTFLHYTIQQKQTTFLSPSKSVIGLVKTKILACNVMYYIILY